jgi:GNAT superfamily N-acetyltransferase
MSRADQPRRKSEGRTASAGAGCSFAKGPATAPIARIEGGYDVRKLDGNDLAELFALHRKIIHCLAKPELYVAKDEQYFKLRLVGDFAPSTVILGAFYEGRMIAYSSVRFIWYEAQSPALLVTPKPSWQDIMIAMMEDAAVDPDHRGHGIQRLLNRAKADIARQQGVSLHVTLVDANNVPSLHTLLGERFAAIGTSKVASGLIRLVLARYVDKPQVKPVVLDYPPISDWDEIGRMFLRGCVGVDVRELGGPEKTVGLIFARPSA